MFNLKTPTSFTLNYKDKILTINIKKLNNTKKISLKPCFKTFGGKVIVPSYISFSQIRRFAYKNIEWLYTILNKNNPINIINLQSIPLFGNQVKIKIENIKKHHKPIILKDNTLTIYLSLNNISKNSNLFKKFFQKLAREYIINSINYYSNCMGVNYNKIIIRDNVTRWGSCSSKKNISLNWRLIFAPKEILDYVIIHEVAHLVHFNHSKEFWKLVEKYQPSFKENKKWLKNHGTTLYNITFDT